MLTSTPMQATGVTKLGRAVRSVTSKTHTGLHQTTSWLRDVILGGQDGLVNVLGISLGQSALRRAPRSLLTGSDAGQCGPSPSRCRGLCSG
jgi:hypothetical protein